LNDLSKQSGAVFSSRHSARGEGEKGGGKRHRAKGVLWSVPVPQAMLRAALEIAEEHELRGTDAAPRAHLNWFLSFIGKKRLRNNSVLPFFFALCAEGTNLSSRLRVPFFCPVVGIYGFMSVMPSLRAAGRPIDLHMYLPPLPTVPGWAGLNVLYSFSCRNSVLSLFAR